MTYHVGITGTQEGMTVKQAIRFGYWLGLHTVGPQEYLVFHLGDCIGADDNAYDIVKLCTDPLPYTTFVGHIPDNDSKRAFREYDEERPPRPYLARNRNIVTASEILIAFPKGFEEELRSGTWATIREAGRQDKPVVIIYPDGKIGHWPDNGDRF